MTIKNYFSRKIDRTRRSLTKTFRNCNLLVFFDEGEEEEDWNGCPEINLTYHFCKQFHPFCFFHVPFKKTTNGRYDNHFDAFVYDKSSGVAIIVEAKRLFNISKLASLTEDCNRIKRNIGSAENDTGISSIIKRFEKRHNIYIERRKIFSLILAEVWQENIALWWEIGQRAFDKKRKNQEISNRRNWDAWNRKCYKSELGKYDCFSTVKIFDSLPSISSPLYCCYADKRIRGIPKG